MSENKKYTILYVDDEESNLRIFKNTFRRDYNILTATSGDLGLELLQREEVDLILTDQRMPGMSGIDFLKNAMEKYPELNRILVTAYSDYDILREAVNELKIFQYVEKPWREEDIKTTIDSALEIHRLKIENQKLTQVLQKSYDDLTHVNQSLLNEIEQHKLTQEALIAEKEYAQQCNMLKSAFLANMSHEVRTPMNSIMGFSDLIMEQDLEPQTRNQYLQVIYNSCTQLLNIMTDIVEISKIESGNIEVVNAQLDVVDLVNEAFAFCAPLAQKKKLLLRIETTLGIGQVWVWGDRNRLIQALNHLIENGIKFTDVGEVVVYIAATESQVEIRIKDSGVGIDPAHFDLIFDRFSQVENFSNRKHGGNGLGLAIVKAYIELMSGKIWVESELGQGATFGIQFPRFTNSY